MLTYVVCPIGNLERLARAKIAKLRVCDARVQNEKCVLRNEKPNKQWWLIQLAVE